MARKGLIAGALSGLASAAGDIAGGHIKAKQELDLRKELSAMEEQRQLRIAEATESMRRKGKQADFEQGLANAPRATEAETIHAKALAKAKGESEREAETAFGQDLGAQAGVRAKARAQDLGGAERALRSQEVAVRLDELKASNAEKREIQGLLDQAAEYRAGGNEDGAQQTEAIVRTKLGQLVKGDEKSFSDVTALSRSWLTAAKDLEKEAELAEPAEAARLKADATEYRRRERELSGAITAKRGIAPRESPTSAPRPPLSSFERNPRKASGIVTQE